MTTEPNQMQRSNSTTALLDAYDRLRANKGSATDGKLTVTSVAREAGVSRATAYRCAELLDLFERPPKSVKTKPKRPNGNSELNAAIKRLLNRLVMLEAVIEARDAEIRELRTLLPAMAVVNA